MRFGVPVPNNWHRGSDQMSGGRVILGVGAGATVAGIEAYRRAGVAHGVLALNTGEIARIAGLMADIAEKVIPRCRQE